MSLVDQFSKLSKQNFIIPLSITFQADDTGSILVARSMHTSSPQPKDSLGGVGDSKLGNS